MSDISTTINVKADLPNLTGMNFGEAVARLQQYLGFDDDGMAQALNQTLDRYQDVLHAESGLSFTGRYNESAPINANRYNIDKLKESPACPMDSNILNALIHLVKDQPQFDNHVKEEIIHALNIGSRNRFLKGNESSAIADRQGYVGREASTARNNNRADRAVWENPGNVEMIKSGDPMDQLEATLIMLHALAARAGMEVDEFNDERRGDTLMRMVNMAGKKGAGSVKEYLMDLFKKYHISYNREGYPTGVTLQEDLKKIVEPIGQYFQAAGITQSGPALA